MAEIEVERRPKRRTGVWIAVVLGLIVAAVAAWYYLLGPGVEREGAMEAEDTVDVFAPAPTAPPTPLPGDTLGGFDTIGGSVPDTGGAIP